METTNKYYVSVLFVEVDVNSKKIKLANIVGFNLVIKDLVVTSSG